MQESMEVLNIFGKPSYSLKVLLGKGGVPLSLFNTLEISDGY